MTANRDFPPPVPPRTSNNGNWSGNYSNAPPFGNFSFGPTMYHNPPTNSHFMTSYPMRPNDYHYNSNSYGDPSLQVLSGVESVVNTINAVATLFESSYFALSNSVRAITAAGDQFLRLREELLNIIRSVSIIKGVAWIIRRILVFLRLRKVSKQEEAWSDSRMQWGATSPSGSGLEKDTNRLSGLLFFAFVIGAPWAMYKLVKRSQKEETAWWMTGNGPHYVAEAKHNFKPVYNDEVALEAGQRVIVATSRDYVRPIPSGWLLVSINGQTSGIVPANYLELVENNSNKAPSPPSPSRTEQLNSRQPTSSHHTQDHDNEFQII